jgi:SH3-like domain-containing protein
LFRSTPLVAVALSFALAAPAAALDYQTTSRAAVLYDAPASSAGKLAVAGSGVPLEVVVETAAWIKVRDASGRLAWIERTALGGARNVMVKADTAAVRKQPHADAETVFTAIRGVLLEVAGDVDGYGWLPVKHADAGNGWIPLHEVWGR